MRGHDRDAKHWSATCILASFTDNACGHTGLDDNDIDSKVVSGVCGLVVPHPTSSHIYRKQPLAFPYQTGHAKKQSLSSERAAVSWKVRS